jgi:hypothetical protein
MRKIVNHKITKITYSVISIILMVCFVLAVDYRVIKKENLFIFLPGLLLSITLSIIVIAVLVCYKKVTLNTIIHFHKFKFILYFNVEFLLINTILFFDILQYYFLLISTDYCYFLLLFIHYAYFYDN